MAGWDGSSETANWGATTRGQQTGERKYPLGCHLEVIPISAALHNVTFPFGGEFRISGLSLNAREENGNKRGGFEQPS